MEMIVQGTCLVFWLFVSKFTHGGRFSWAGLVWALTHLEWTRIKKGTKEKQDRNPACWSSHSGDGVPPPGGLWPPLGHPLDPQPSYLRYPIPCCRSGRHRRPRCRHRRPSRAECFKATPWVSIRERRLCPCTNTVVHWHQRTTGCRKKGGRFCFIIIAQNDQRGAKARWLS